MISTEPEASFKRSQLYPGVSCVTYDARFSPSAMRDVNYFDVPDQDYLSGNVTGVKAFWEVAKAAAEDEDDEIFLPIIAAAQKLLDTKYQRGAAAAFLWTVNAALVFASKQPGFAGFMMKELKVIEKDYTDEIKLNAHRMRETNQAFIGNMLGTGFSAASKAPGKQKLEIAGGKNGSDGCQRRERGPKSAADAVVQRP